MFSRLSPTRTMLALVGALGVLASGLATTTDVVSAAADGYGTAIGNLVSGPTVQSASNSWQYFEIPDSLSSATLLPNWQTTGNECVLNQNQWDNNRVNGNYPFVQFVQTRPASNLHGGNTFGANAELLIHPDNSSYRAAIGWKNTTGATVLIDYAATLKLAFPQNNNDGIAYSFQRGLSGTARYLSLKSGTISNGSTATSQLNGSLVELQSGELVYLTVGNKGNYYWDHTIATMSISLTSPPTSSVVGADTVVTFSSVGSRTWTVPAGVSSVRYLVVGGGGGGGSDNGGGGGAGGYLAGLSLATTPGAKSSTSSGVPNGPSAGTSFDSSTTMMNRGDIDATIFSRVCAAPPPLVRLNAGSTSSAPSMAMSSAPISSGEMTFKPSEIASSWVCTDVEVHTMSSARSPSSMMVQCTVEPVPRPTRIPSVT